MMRDLVILAVWLGIGLAITGSIASYFEKSRSADYIEKSRSANPSVADKPYDLGNDRRDLRAGGSERSP